VLTYHRVNPVKHPSFEPNININVTPEAFSEQLALISKECCPISLPAALSGLYTGSLPRNAVVITFDDGYRDNLTNALPILEKFGVPATVYITTSFIDGSDYPWWYEQEVILRSNAHLAFEFKGQKFDFPLSTGVEKDKAALELNRLFKTLGAGDRKEARCAMLAVTGQPARERLFLSWDEVCELGSNPLITIGAHTLTHQSLAHIADPELKKEIFESKAILEKHVGHKIEHFSYPYGYVENAAKREALAVKEAGFISAVTSRFGHVQPDDKCFPYLLPRIHIDYFDDLWELRWKLSGFAARKVRRSMDYINEKLA
jgi:peptidoglycan/xylan/chitin deacetylase (PgdA/CDA1 family)